MVAVKRTQMRRRSARNCLLVESSAPANELFSGELCLRPEGDEQLWAANDRPEHSLGRLLDFSLTIAQIFQLPPTVKSAPVCTFGRHSGAGRAANHCWPRRKQSAKQLLLSGGGCGSDDGGSALMRRAVWARSQRLNTSPPAPMLMINSNRLRFTRLLLMNFFPLPCELLFFASPQQRQRRDSGHFPIGRPSGQCATSATLCLHSGRPRKRRTTTSERRVN